MPNHLHAILSFAPDQQMNRIKWQEGFFDHRLRNDERGEQLSAKADYIRRNPVAAGLCERVEDWPWVYPHPKADRVAPALD